MSRMVELREEQQMRYAPPVETAGMVPPKPEDLTEEEKAELRRQMYERIARGHALAEAEDMARRRWRGR